MIKHAIALATALSLAGCATTPGPTMTQSRYTRPDVGQVSTREIGEPLFEVEVATRFPGARLTGGNQIAGPFGSKITFATDQLFAMPFGGKTAYCGPATMQPVLGFPSPMPNYCMTEDQLRKANAAFVVTDLTRVDPANFRQELLYQGKSGNTLKISYREFSADLARPAFSQDLTFDLSEGSTIGTKGARLEVIEATNTSIKYRLLQPFTSAR
ncbi:hypothetical protein ACO2Q0_02810 [Phenylobacterium sp. VNQ135]|uniref:hypothetical protein n=1 Tax=Phenylobacterium sp. VNQ135 TaxID=3400922 RepID=UPI003C0B06F0